MRRRSSCSYRTKAACAGRSRLATAIALLGLLAVLLAALVALAPALASARGAPFVERWFADHYRGRIELAELDLAWSEGQSAKGIALFDPEGARVAEVELRLPPLWGLARSFGRELGTIEVDLSVDVTTDAAGQTNLARALEPREPPPEEEGPVELPEFELALNIERATWRGPVAEDGRVPEPVVLAGLARAKAAPGQPLAASADLALGEGGAGGRIELEASVSPSVTGDFAAPARVEWQVHGAELALEPWVAQLSQQVREAWEPAALEARGLLSAEARSFDAELASGPARFVVEGRVHAAPFALPGLAASDAWDVEITADATDWPAELIDALAERNGLLTDAFGSDIDVHVEARFQGTQLADARLPLEVALTSRHAKLGLSGRLEEGRFVSDPGRGVSAELGLTPLVRERVVGSLLPMLVRPERPADAEPIRFELTGIDLDLEEGPLGMSGALSMALGPAQFSLLPGIEAELVGPLRFEIPSGMAFALSLASGVVHYQDLGLKIRGVALPLGGSFDLRSRAFDLSGSLPASLWSADLEKKLGPAAAALGESFALPFTIGGTPAAPRIQIAAPDLGDAVQQGLEEGLREELQKQLEDHGLPKLDGRDLPKSLEELMGGPKKKPAEKPPAEKPPAEDPEQR